MKCQALAFGRSPCPMLMIKPSTRLTSGVADCASAGFPLRLSIELERSIGSQEPVLRKPASLKMEMSYISVDVSTPRLDIKGLAELVERLSVLQLDQIAIEATAVSRPWGRLPRNASLAAARGRQSRKRTISPGRLASTPRPIGSTL